MTIVSDSTAVGDVVSGSAAGVRSRLWRLRPAEVRDVAVSVSAEILRLEAIRVAAVDELALNPDEQVLCYRGVGRWLAANTMLQNAAGNKIAALGAALRSFPDIAAQFEAGDLSLDHAALIAAFCESPPKGMPDMALTPSLKTLLAAASGVEATTTKLRYAIAVLERIFESDQPPPGEDNDLNALRIAPTLNGRVVIKGDFDALTGEMLLSALSGLSMPKPAADGTPDQRSAAKRTADAFTELIRRYLDNAVTGVDGGQRPHVNVHITAKDLAEHRECASMRSDAASDIADAEPDDNANVGDGALYGGAFDDDQPAFEDLDVGYMPWMGPLSVSKARMLACDCMLSTVLMDGKGAPLDATPLKRLVTAEQRIALIARDKGCAFPNCDAVPAWCDAHHIKPWSMGGLTVMDNLVLLCRSHHTLIHSTSGFRGIWEIKMGNDHKPWFIPPSAIDPKQRRRRSTTRQGPVHRD